MVIPKELIAEILEKADIGEVIKGYIDLTEGVSNLFGRCPFHAGDVKSFTVSREKRFFHCFGCGKNGNAITFIVQYCNVGFVDAVKELADVAGVDMPVPPKNKNRVYKDHAEDVRRDDYLQLSAETVSSALQVLRFISKGTNPFNKKPLDAKSIVNNPMVSSAILAGIRALENIDANSQKDRLNCDGSNLNNNSHERRRISENLDFAFSEAELLLSDRVTSSHLDDPVLIIKEMVGKNVFSAYGVIAQCQLANILEKHGFEVYLEVPAPTFDRNGFIDLLAVRGEFRVGIEIDSWRTPKSKSVMKLGAMKELTHRVILLNHGNGMKGRRVFFS